MDNEKAVLIANLQEQLSIFDAQLAALESQNPLDITQYNAIRAEREEAQKKLDAVNAEINAGIEAQEAVSSQFENIQIGEETVNLRALTTNESAYQILSIWFQQYVGDMAQKHTAIVQSYESQVNKLQDDVAEIESLRRSNVDLADKLADMETKRDAAATELAEAQEEAKRLATDNESLRKQLEASNKPLQTNSNTDLAALAKQFNESKPAIYNKRWENELTKKNYLAELAKTGETITFSYLEAGKYREVSAAEAETFREQAPEVEGPVQSEPVPDNTLVEPPPSIPSEEDATLPTNSADREVDTETVGRSEYEALKARVEKIERTLNIEVAA